jgi:hypothetical protein
VNVPRLEQVMRFITAYPQLHDQETWLTTDTPCGTVACLAGWTCLLNGYEPAVTDWDVVEDDGSCSLITVRKVDDPLGRLYNVPDLASEILELKNSEIVLFAASQTLDSLWRRVEILTDGQVTR